MLFLCESFNRHEAFVKRILLGYGRYDRGTNLRRSTFIEILSNLLGLYQQLIADPAPSSAEDHLFATRHEYSGRRSASGGRINTNFNRSFDVFTRGKMLELSIRLRECTRRWTSLRPEVSDHMAVRNYYPRGTRLPSSFATLVTQLFG